MTVRHAGGWISGNFDVRVKGKAESGIYLYIVLKIPSYEREV